MAVDAGTAAGQMIPSGETSSGDYQSALPGVEDVVDYDVAEADSGTDGSESQAGRFTSPLMPAFVAGLIAVVTLGALTGWLGYRAHESQQMKAERDSFLQVARQGAVNLTTIDHAHADADIQRILDSATGQFYDEFSQRSAPFVDVVKKSQSNSQGTVTEAGLESVSGDEAQVIVAVSVKTAVANAPEQQPRSWRMRVTVQKSGGDMKIAKVGFVA